MSGRLFTWGAELAQPQLKSEAVLFELANILTNPQMHTSYFQCCLSDDLIGTFSQPRHLKSYCKSQVASCLAAI
jgi:hypothetical protein